MVALLMGRHIHNYHYHTFFLQSLVRSSLKDGRKLREDEQIVIDFVVVVVV